MKYRLTIRSASGKPFTRDFDCDGVRFEGWWAVLFNRGAMLLDEGPGNAFTPKQFATMALRNSIVEPFRYLPDQIVAAASSEHLLCIERLRDL